MGDRDATFRPVPTSPPADALVSRGAPPAAAAPVPAAGKRVAVLGGGASGLSAAHELAERGYAVTVHE
ncbi:hypothetical protein SGFS_070660 [Streptomyces graminofaciens]|uniref:FAD dependent oxidoreductase domain-containing protein n=1 Tax=Streptomyces graminofaciens TaxID=68212 RepID=A0ABM7FFB1_9ACTN|nr:hypothetical protein SGFS_070660 [Streptomyces graminofaciens]